MTRLALSLILWISVISAALAQNVTVIGPITTGDCAMFNSPTVVKDGGFPCPGSGGTLNLPNGTTATTQSTADNTTKVATDAFVQNVVSAQTTHFAAGGTSTGTANAQVIATTSPPVFSLTGNPTVTFNAGFSNSGATTLNVVSTGVISVLKRTSLGLIPLVSGDIIAGQQYLATYDGTQYELQTPSSVITGTSDAFFATGRPWCDIRAKGATGSTAGASKSADTTAFTTCLSNLNSTYGGGIIYVPPPASGSCYYFDTINATAINNITVKGSGSSSCIKINGKDSSNNWLDTSGSSGWVFEDVDISADGSTIPAVAILWACTGTSCGTSGVLHGLAFNRVNITANTTKAILYGYGFGNVSNPGSHGSLSIRDSTWTQTNNGSSQATPSNRNSIVHITATNDLSITSANKTIATSTVYAWGTLFSNFQMFDQPAGIAAPNDNNASLVLFNISQFLMQGGALECACDRDLVIASNSQGLQFDHVNFQGDGISGNPNYWIFIGQGLNTFITFDTPFFSTPTIATVILGPPVGSLGGVWYLNMLNTNSAGSPGSLGFIYTDTATCGAFSAGNPWISASILHLYTPGSGTAVQTCGSIDNRTFFTGGTPTVTVPSGASDNSFKVPLTTLGASAPLNLGGTSGSVGLNDATVILNPGGTFTLTLPSASLYSGRILLLKLIGAQIVNSASSNVVPISSITAGTAIFPATAGKWATLQSDGTNWITMAAN